MTMHVRNAGGWSPSVPSVRNNGGWSTVREAWVRANGAWHRCHSSPPTDLTATDTSACVLGSSEYGVHLSWTPFDGSHDTAIYESGSLVATVAAGTSSYDYVPAGAGSYSYTVRTVYADGESLDSVAAALVVSDPC